MACLSLQLQPALFARHTVPLRRCKLPRLRCLQADEHEDVAGSVSQLLSQLAAGQGPETPLRRLAVDLDSYFALPWGELIAARRLLEPAAAEMAAAAGLDVRQWEGTASHVQGDTTPLRVLLTPCSSA